MDDRRQDLKTGSRNLQQGDRRARRAMAIRRPDLQQTVQESGLQGHGKAA